VAVQRFASVIALRPEMEREYRKLHHHVWASVLETLKNAHVGNYSIFLRDGLLFSYLEYTGEDFEADLAAVAADENTDSEWWAPAEELFHLD
jgi:L-rhamnose mutarotase